MHDEQKPMTSEPVKKAPLSVAGRFTRIDGESYYTIRNYDLLPPFLMSVVSDSDHWMFISSNGGLTAGRANSTKAIFPYETEDMLHQCHDFTGPRTSLWITQNNGDRVLWEPFRESAKDNYDISRNLYKSELGNTLIFEEVNHGLNLSFRYGWCYSDRFGIVRDAVIANAGDSEIEVHLMDGLLNLLPAGLTPQVTQQRHCLADAYKHSEVDPQTGLGIYSLSSMILDRPEPGETLYATTVWNTGLPSPAVVLDPAQLSIFRSKGEVSCEPVLKGRKGAYLLSDSLTLAPGQTHRWQIVADAMQTQTQVAGTQQILLSGEGLADALTKDCREGGLNLRKNLASADGLQQSGSATMNAHHLANVLFNNMRGGVFDHNYDVGRDDLIEFISSRNKPVAERCHNFLNGLPDTTSIQVVIESAQQQNDANLIRLCYEYLPIYFSRRHGDPSRPWNFFDIRLRDERGKHMLSYQGNWRDIFQNWEALSISFPGFLPSIIAKFVNASTADGYNPYRITRESIDWEAVEPDDPWSNIGYWGDHQIIYLLKFLETLDRYDPQRIPQMLKQDIFSYADVPYTIKPYDQVLNDPHDTIEFDYKRAGLVDQRVREAGSDGRLLADQAGGVYHVNLAEKLLVPALSKLSNLVLDGGLWLNTQRPEWNDANNALVGNGLSVVTLCYLRRYLKYLAKTMGEAGAEEIRLSKQVADWLGDISKALSDHAHLIKQERVSDEDRMSLLNALGTAFGDYRQQLYASGLVGKTTVPRGQVASMIESAIAMVDHSIRVNRRDDGLYHAYNLMTISASRDEVGVEHLYKMLEGQVAVLSSGLLDTKDVLKLLEVMRGSDLYRPDQDSYILYPNRELPAFLEKNVVPADQVEKSKLLCAMIQAQNHDIISRDAGGKYRFHSAFYNVKELSAALDKLDKQAPWRDLVKQDKTRVCEIYEGVFNHKSFTGRSGGMYGYEGLGCIYWHMISKLLLAVQENYERAVKEGTDPKTIRALAEAYYDVRHGLGFNKTPAEYGAFPTDPYSHTPGFAGARQPGMTGQVKEEVITRWGELGVAVTQGAIRFAPTLIRTKEFLRVESRFNYYDVHSNPKTIELAEGTLGFTFCQVPVVYSLSEQQASVTVTMDDGETVAYQCDTLPADVSHEVFGRTGSVSRIDVVVPERSILD